MKTPVVRLFIRTWLAFGISRRENNASEVSINGIGPWRISGHVRAIRIRKLIQETTRAQKRSTHNAQELVGF